MRMPLVDLEAAVSRFVGGGCHPALRSTAWLGFRSFGDLGLSKCRLLIRVLTPSGAKPFFTLLGPQLRS